MEMALFRFHEAHLEPISRSTLGAQLIRERQDLQAALRDDIAVLSDDLLVVAEEYGRFAESQRRIDLLALDRSGSLVVIELKRTDTGGHMELQALRYAAMVSTMTIEDLVDVYADFADLAVEEARSRLDEWTSEPVTELNDRVRIILVSGDFSTEITSTVLWLSQHYSVDIACYRLVTYAMGGETLIDLQQIIPLPEAKSFQIQQRKKETAASEKKASGRDFTKYDIEIAGESRTDQSKQSVVKFAIQRSFRVGVPLQEIREATNPRRWVGVQPSPGESVEEAFARQFPDRSGYYWFDLNIEDEAASWVIPRFGGQDTEPFLTALQRLAPSGARFTWGASSWNDQLDEEDSSAV